MQIHLKYNQTGRLNQNLVELRCLTFLPITSGEAGAGGVIFDPGGKKMASFTWGHGRRMNNQVEWAALMQGIEMMSDLHLDSFQVYGDSWIIIQSTQNIQSGKRKEVRKVQKRIFSFIPDISKIQFLPIRRHNNILADRQANIGTKLKQGDLLMKNSTKPIVKWISCFQI